MSISIHMPKSSQDKSINFELNIKKKVSTIHKFQHTVRIERFIKKS